ncbi:MAG: hypothetical protein JKX74_05280 [Flavobacteriales bacterium]|nr:hypothetical protein [Flavobacteriales bacterium]
MSDETSLDQEDGPPVFKSWIGWYALLIGVLVSLIGLFYWFTESFS